MTLYRQCNELIDWWETYSGAKSALSEVVATWIRPAGMKQRWAHVAWLPAQPSQLALPCQCIMYACTNLPASSIIRRASQLEWFCVIIAAIQLIYIHTYIHYPNKLHNQLRGSRESIRYKRKKKRQLAGRPPLASLSSLNLSLSLSFHRFLAFSISFLSFLLVVDDC